MNPATDFYKPVLPVALSVETSKTGKPCLQRTHRLCRGSGQKENGEKERQENHVLEGRIQEEERPRAPEEAKPRWFVLVAKAHCPTFRIQLPLGLAFLWSSVLCVSEDSHPGASLLSKSVASI